MEYSTFYLIGLIQLALLGTVILGFQLFGLARYRKSYRALLARYKEQGRLQQGAGQAFLSRQLAETREKQHSSPGSSTRISVWQLRQFYLRSELDALACGEGSEHYWQELEKRLLRVVNAIKAPAETLQSSAMPAAAPAEPASQSQSPPAIEKRSTESLLAVINRQRELINYLREQSLSSDREDKQGIDDHRPVINHRILHMGGGIAALDSQLQRSENRLWGLRDSVIDLHAPRVAQRQREDQDLRIIHHAESDDELDEEDREQMQQEVDTLQQTIHLQQETINSFSEQLGQLREEMLSSLPEEETEAQQLYIARLERLLQETEGCVQVLESELDDLRVQLQESMPAPKDEGTATGEVSQHSEEQLQTELAQLQTMLDNTLLDRDIQAAIIGFAMSGSQCRDLNELGAEALKSLTALGLAGALVIHGRSGRTELYDRSKINAAERKQLNTLTAGNRPQVINIGPAYALATPSLSMLVKADDDVASSMTTHINELMLTFSGLINAFTTKLDAQLQHQKQAQTLKRLQQKTAQTIKGLDIQYKYQTKEFSNAVRQFMKQLEDSFKALPVDERQHRILQLIIEDFRTRMTLLLRSDLSIDKALAELTRSVEIKADR